MIPPYFFTTTELHNYLYTNTFQSQYKMRHFYYTSINIPELSLSIEPSVIPCSRTNEYRIVSAIRSTQQFHHSHIDTKSVHVVIALDTSGSMAQTIPGIDGDESTRVECCIDAICKLLEFFRVLVANGIEIYMSLVSFNTHVIPIFEHKTLTDSIQELELIKETCRLIYPTGATNIGNLLDYISGLREQHANDTTATYSILLSDGYITMGRQYTEIERLKTTNTEWIFDATIGIGEDGEYDSELLDILSKEGKCRGCACVDDLYDNLISSIFQQMDVHASAIEWTMNHYGTIEHQYPLQCSNLRHGQFICASSGIVNTQNPSMEIRMSVRRISIEYTGKYVHEISSGIWRIEYCVEKNIDGRYEVCIRIMADCSQTTNRTIRNRQWYGRMIIDFMKLIREFNTYDLDSKVMVGDLYLHFSKWRMDIESVHSVDVMPIFEQMRAIIDQMWRRIEQLAHQLTEQPDEFDNDLTEPLSDLYPQINIAHGLMPSTILYGASQSPHTPVGNAYQTPLFTPMRNNNTLTPSQTVSTIRMMRSQSNNGNYAFIGRMMTDSYSQSSI